MLSQEQYKAYCKQYKGIENFLKKRGRVGDDVLREICALRGYYPERMCSILKEAGFFYLEELSEVDIKKLRKLGPDYGLFSKEGNFILNNRYVFPVRDMLGNTIALIGWYPDTKKYITTSSRLFSKQGLFFGMEQLQKTGLGKPYFLVEGIFDCLSVRSLGFNCVAQMGITDSRYKNVMYSFFSRLVAIPDNDPEGRGVVGYDKWHLPRNGKYFRWIGDKSKDIDTLCNSYEYEDVKDLLEGIHEDKRRVVTVRV